MASSTDDPKTWQELQREKSYTRLTHEFFNHPAVDTLDPNAYAVMMRVANEFRGFNNGHLHLSIRTAMQRCRLGSKDAASAAFVTLQERGILRLTWKGRRILATGAKIASAWELTELPMRNDMNEEVEPARDYLRWQPEKPVPIIGAADPTEVGYAPAKRKSRAKPKLVTLPNSPEVARIFQAARDGSPLPDDDEDCPFAALALKPYEPVEGNSDDVPF